MQNEYYTLHCGDNLTVLPTIEDESVDLVLTDPPYALVSGHLKDDKQASGGFMNKKWDKALPNPKTWVECLRVLKPGGFAVIMSGARLDCLWRMCRDIEAAGFELNQSAAVWVTRQGFPKGQDFSKAYDQRVGAEREVVGIAKGMGKQNPEWNGTAQGRKENSFKPEYDATLPATETAKELDGWFSKGKIKPAIEFLIVARKPISEKTELDNMLKHGVGGVNCGACMIPSDEPIPVNVLPSWSGFGQLQNPEYVQKQQAGRFPANLLCTGDQPLGDGTKYFDIEKWASEHGYSDDWVAAAEAGVLQISKPSKAEKNMGCESIEPQPHYSEDTPTPQRDNRAQVAYHNNHPTCKPVTLMAYMISLLTKPNAIVLDPFCGSGTTLVAAIQTNRYPIGIELETDYCKITQARADHQANQSPKPTRNTPKAHTISPIPTQNTLF